LSIDSTGTNTTAWDRYGRALIRAMAEVVAEVPDELHELVLETADFWLSVGLSIGTQRPEAGLRLLDIIESESIGQTELAADAEAFTGEALA